MYAFTRLRVGRAPPLISVRLLNKLRANAGRTLAVGIPLVPISPMDMMRLETVSAPLRYASRDLDHMVDGTGYE